MACSSESTTVGKIEYVYYMDIFISSYNILSTDIILHTSYQTVMIRGVESHTLQVNTDERGHLVEVFREDWELYDPAPAMTYYSMSYPGVVRAWHKHRRGQVDHFVCPKGRIKVGIYDDREDSPTQGDLDTFVIGEHNQQAIRVPGNCWHGFKTIGNEPAFLLNFPTKLYDYDDPDEQRLPPDTDAIPLDWDETPH